jgi:hypothetical protein
MNPQEPRLTEEFTALGKELATLTTGTPGELHAQRHALIAAGDKGGVMALDRERLATAQRKTAILRRRLEIQEALDALPQQASGHPPTEPDTRTVDNKTGRPVAQAPVPAPAQPFVAPAIRAAQAAVPPPPVAAPLVPQQPMKDEGIELMEQAVARRKKAQETFRGRH